LLKAVVLLQGSSFEKTVVAFPSPGVLPKASPWEKPSLSAVALEMHFGFAQAPISRGFFIFWTLSIFYFLFYW